MENSKNFREGDEIQKEDKSYEQVQSEIIGKEISDNLEQNPELKEVFDKLISTHKVKGIIKDLLEEFDEQQLSMLALPLAKEKPGLVGEYFEYFKQTNKEYIFSIAKTMAYSDGAWLMKYFEKFPIEEEEKRFELVMIMLNKTEDEYKKGLIEAGEDDKIAGMVSEEAQFAVYEKVGEYFDKLNITSSDYIDQIKDKIKEFDENLYQRYEEEIEKYKVH